MHNNFSRIFKYLISSISKVHAKQVSIMTQWRRVKYENLKRKSTGIFDLEEKIWGFLTFGSHRWADLSCYNILHGWEAIQEFLRFLFFFEKSNFYGCKYFYNFQNDPQPENPPKMSVLLRGGSFLLTTTTDKTTITIMIFTPYYQVFLYLTTNRVTIRS